MEQQAQGQGQPGESIWKTIWLIVKIIIVIAIIIWGIKFFYDKRNSEQNDYEEAPKKKIRKVKQKDNAQPAEVRYAGEITTDNILYKK